MSNVAITSSRRLLIGTEPSDTVQRLPMWAMCIPSLVGAALVAIATRDDPLLSPDSITYLSAARHVRAGQGLTDFTNKPLAVFGPIYPLLLSPGGRSLVWATLIGILSIAAASALIASALRTRVRPSIALAGGFAFAAGEGFVRMASVVWSEAPYAAIALGTLVVLARAPLTTKTCAIGGLLAGVGFLTRYAGIGLVASGAVFVVALSWRNGRRATFQHVGAFVGTAAGISAVWVVRNLVETGQPLGPRFEGGAAEALSRTIRLAFIGTGHIIAGDGWSESAKARIGEVIVIALVVAIVFALRSSRGSALDIAMAAFALTSFVVPIVARRITANDIELRVMSPMVIPVIYFACVVADRILIRPTIAVLATVLLGWWMYQGVAFAARFPDLAPGGAGYRPQFAPRLYDAIDALPADATILTNSPQRVWWFTHREPTLMGFTTPRPGNSHYPLDARHTLDEACSGRAHLAWFDSLQNAGTTPQQRRPDLAAIVDLHLETSVGGGQLYLLAPIDPSTCRSGTTNGAAQG
ncbi:MAG TPA: hypothetical protein VGC84_12385 [Ilumatobacteraceae bacterium]